MSTFDIAIYAIAALALIFVFFAIIEPYLGPKDHFSEIQTALLSAQISTNLGKTLSVGSLTYQPNTTILTNSFDKEKMLVAIECTSAQNCCQRKSDQKDKCTKPINWDYTFFTSNELKSIPTYVRCIKLSELPVCKIYFGGTPAQTKIENAELNPSAAADAIGIMVTLKNTGSLPITSATTTVELLKKGTQGWVSTDYIQTPKSIDLLNANEQTTQKFELNPQNIGEYRAKFTFESQNAGFDTKTIDFNKTTNTFCTATTIGDTLFNSDANSYRELRNCMVCQFFLIPAKVRFAHRANWDWNGLQLRRSFRHFHPKPLISHLNF